MSFRWLLLSFLLAFDEPVEPTPVVPEVLPAAPAPVPIPPLVSQGHTLAAEAVRQLFAGDRVGAIQSAAVGISQFPEYRKSYQLLLELASGPLGAPPAPSSNPPTDAGRFALGIASEHLGAGRMEEAARASVEGVSTYPELEASFRAIAEVALRRNDRSIVGDRSVGGTTPSTPIFFEEPKEPWVAPGKKWGRPNNLARFRMGFDAGLTTGVRAELTLNRAVDGLGLRAGGNLVVFEGQAIVVGDVGFYMDFRLTKTWQLEPVVGMLVSYGWLYPHTGVAVQYDPPGPFQAQLGGRLGFGPSFVPDASVGFIW